MRLSRRRGQVTHVLLTRSPLIHTHQKEGASPFDLHVLSTPPAFVLSQDQTLQTKPTKTSPNQPQTIVSQNPKSVQQSRKPDQAQPNPHNKKMRTRQTKTKQTPKTTHKHAQPPGPWHKKHDTLSSSQTTHPAGTQSSLLTQLRSGEQLRYSRTFVGSTSTSEALFPVTPIDVLL